MGSGNKVTGAEAFGTGYRMLCLMEGSRIGTADFPENSVVYE